jgi:putative membrane protein
MVVLFIAAAVARYLTTRYGLSADALHVRSGVFARQQRVIPFGRIQTVNVRQSAIQRLLRMSELRVETATQGLEAEVTLSVLPWGAAQALREQLVAERRRALDTVRVGTDAAPDAASSPAAEHANASLSATVTDAPAPRIITSLDTERLMVAGATSNNVVALLALLVSGFDRIRSSFFDDLDLTDGVIGVLGSVQGAIGDSAALVLFVLLVLVPLLVGAWVVSVGGSVVRWYGFTLEQVGRDLRRRYGFFSRVETSVPMMRAQALRYHESMLRRPFGLGELVLVSAGSVLAGRSGEGGTQVLLPILRRPELSGYVPVVFPAATIGDVLARSVRESPWRRPMQRAVLRVAASESIAMVLLLVALAVWRPQYLAATAWLLPLIWCIAWLQVRARGLAIADGHVIVRRGGISRSTIILPESKLQLIEVRQGPLQRLIGSATLRLTTAGVGGDVDMEDLPLDEARVMQQDLQARLARTVRRTVRPSRS